jgi:4-hydroxy-tetrahydrodipicolinate synthase
MRSLSSGTLQGLWSAVPTPWTPAGRLDQDMLARNCHRLIEAGVDGIYTTDSDGEFYAIELAEFRTLARAFGKAMRDRGPRGPFDAAMGVTWCNTQGIIDRLKGACDAGIPNVHVAFPFFMPLAKDDVDRFFDDLATAVPQARWVHYAHPRCGPALTGRDYARLSARFPEQFIGTKVSPTDTTVLSEILLNAPNLAHFVVDPIMLTGMLLGAKGCYSYWVNTLPAWHRHYMDCCLSGKWDEARGYHLKLIRFELDHISKLRAAGYLHGIIGKARGALSRFLEDTGQTRPPYYLVPQQMLLDLRRGFEQFWKTELAREAMLHPR